MTAAESGTHGASFDPEPGTSAAVQLSILGQQPYVVAHADPPGERDVPVGQGTLPVRRLPFGEGEQVGDPLRRDMHHPAGAPAPPTASSHAWGRWHTGQ